MKISVLLFCPSGFTTVTAEVPAVLDGAVTVIELLPDETMVACSLPTYTAAPDSKFLPAMLNCVPPATVPELGDKALIKGAKTNV